jgi:hypothetical protein
MTTLALILLLSPALPAAGPAGDLPDDSSPPVDATYRQPDPSGTGWLGRPARPPYGSSVATFVLFFPDDPMTPVCLVDLDQCDLSHESEPGVPMPRHDAIGRPARLVAPRYVPGEGVRPVARGSLVVTGGMGVRAWGEAMAAAYEAPEPPEDDLLRRFVEVGFRHPRQEVRDRVVRLLVGKGVDALPALLVGGRSKDWEVRDRAEWAIEELRTGLRVQWHPLGGGE